MSYVTINGTDYKVPEINFDAICELEENGVYLLTMSRNDRRFATMIRGLTAWIMKSDTATASEEIQEHIKNGGNIMEILDAVMEAMNESGFFNGQNNKAARIPQDHRRPKNRQRNNHGKNTHPSQS